MEKCIQTRKHKNTFTIRTKTTDILVSGSAVNKPRWWEKRHAKTVAWSYDMEGHARKCVERCCELANKKVEQLYKVSSLCLDDHELKQEELESVGELSKVCSQVVFKHLSLARIGRLYGLPTNLQEQSQNGLRLATNVWQDRFHTFITQMTTENIVMWATRLSSDFAGYFEDTKSTTVRVL